LYLGGTKKYEGENQSHSEQLYFCNDFHQDKRGIDFVSQGCAVLNPINLKIENMVHPLQNYQRSAEQLDNLIEIKELQV